MDSTPARRTFRGSGQFDRIKSNNSTLFADTIKTLSDQSISATVILVGVADSVDDLIREHQSIERAMVQIPMPRMSPEEIYQIINNGLERIGMTIARPGLDQIGSLAQGLPHYAHLLGLHSSRTALDDEHMEINLEHAERAIRNSTEGAQQSIRTAYTKAISSPRSENLYRQVLLACALAPTDDLGYFSAADVRNPMTTIMGKYYDIPSFARHLKEFSEPLRGEILSKTGPERRIRYRFVNPLMQPYVIMRGVSDGLINRENLAKVRSR
jgi:vacuolar-type H+-ATPase subunit F/Vma7